MGGGGDRSWGTVETCCGTGWWSGGELAGGTEYAGRCIVGLERFNSRDWLVGSAKEEVWMGQLFGSRTMEVEVWKL